jgi:Na+/phosphate symporter
MMSMASMVASGLPLASAIRFGVPMVLGANVGTTVENTLTLLAIRKATTKEEFNATIPGVLVDDIFKFLTVGLFFALEVTTGVLSTLVTGVGAFLYDTFQLEGLLAVFDKTIIDVVITEPIVKPLGRVFTMWFGPQLSGILFFILWFALVVVSIDFLITKGLNKLIQTDWATRVSSAFHGPLRAFTTGFSLTWLVGSSSIGTSLVIPMIATKMVTVDQAYPYICGCSLGTTVDLAQLYGYVAGGIVGVMLGLTHVLLTLFGLILWLISPLRVMPVQIAKHLGQFMTSHRSSAVLLIGYALCVFIGLPILVILLG